MSHAENFVHAGDESIDGSGAANLVVEFGGKFFTAGDDLLTLMMIWVPGVFGFGASVLTEGAESELGETILDDFVALY